MILFFDTETTGKVFFKEPPDAKGQPRIIQIGALLTTDEGVEISHTSLLLKTDNFEVPVEASAVHGFTTEFCNKNGIERKAGFHIFNALSALADIVVGHNIDFDLFMFDIEGVKHGGEFLVSRNSIPKFCTMKASTNICCLPGPYGFKWPRLSEAYKFFFNEEFEGAHDAMADVRACKRIYFELKKKGAVK